ncbi:MAG: YlbF family regulator [Bacilli bacterium]|nr:YlbF family regulator [Bacilli bacterium]
MNELIDLVDNLKDSLDETTEVKNIKELNKEISKDKDLLELIKKYNLTHDEKLKSKILSNELFNKYKDNEIELNLLIMKINHELKKMSIKKGCLK